MSAAITIRKATAADAATVHRFIHALAVYEREPDAVEVSPEELREQLDADRPPFECVLAEEHGEPRGFALFFHNYSTWRGRHGIYLEDLFVPAEHRARGIGGALLRHVAQLAVSRGCKRLEWAVLDWNAPAIGFYRQLGAVPMDEWTVFRLTGDALDRFGAV